LRVSAIHLPTVVAAAIKEDGTVFALPAPARHHDIIHFMVHKYQVAPPVRGKQGFLLSDGSFVDRVVAKVYADCHGQILTGMGQRRELFSEDLW
jgi:hypothetical protein